MQKSAVCAQHLSMFAEDANVSKMEKHAQTAIKRTSVRTDRIEVLITLIVT